MRSESNAALGRFKTVLSFHWLAYVIRNQSIHAWGKYDKSQPVSDKFKNKISIASACEKWLTACHWTMQISQTLLIGWCHFPEAGYG
jgi:hypothetical protein